MFATKIMLTLSIDKAIESGPLNQGATQLACYQLQASF